MGARLLAAATLAALVGVAGCTSGSAPEPAPLPSEPPSASQSSSPSPAAPTLPAEADGTSPAAAKAFARHYFETVNYAALTGDTENLRSLGSRRCVSCEAIASNIEEVYASGGMIVEEDWGIRSMRVVQSTAQRAFVSITATLAPEVTVYSDGNRHTREGGEQPMSMVLDRASSRTVVAQLDMVR